MPPRQRTVLPGPLGALLAVLVLVSMSQQALAQEDPNRLRYLQENFFKLEDAAGPPLCKGEWCAVVIEICCLSGMPSYEIFLRDPKGNVTEIPGGGIGSKPEFVLDDQGRIKVDDAHNPWPIDIASSTGEADEETQIEPSGKVLQAALAACKKASPSCARQFVSTKGSCNQRGCVLSASGEDNAPSCFMWQAAGSGKMDLLGVYPEAFGYSGPDFWLGTKAVSVTGEDCKSGCSVESTALLGDRLRRTAEPGEIPQSRSPLADTSQITPVTAFRLRHVTHGVFSWDNALDASVRWQLALLPDHVQLTATVLDDVLELEPCVGGKRPAVRCDHLELIAEDGPARGAMVSILLLPGGAARAERWREPGGKEIQQPLEAKRCSWARVEKRQVPGAGHELAIQCQLPRGVLWGEGASRSLSLRYSDAEEGQQQSLVSVTQVFRASTEYPPVFVPKVEKCAPAVP